MYTPKWAHTDILYVDTDLTKFHLHFFKIITVCIMYIYIWVLLESLVGWILVALNSRRARAIPFFRQVNEAELPFLKGIEVLPLMEVLGGEHLMGVDLQSGTPQSHTQLLGILHFANLHKFSFFSIPMITYNKG